MQRIVVVHEDAAIVSALEKAGAQTLQIAADANLAPARALDPSLVIVDAAFLRGALATALVSDARLSAAALLVGAVLKGAGLASLVSAAAFMIVIVGTVAAIFIQTPLAVMKDAFRILPWIFNPPANRRAELVKKMVDWSNTARKQGLLGLEPVIDKETDAFVRKGYRFAGTATVVERGEAGFDTLLPLLRSSLAHRIRAIVTISVTRALPLTSPAYDDGASEPELRRAWTARFRLLQPSGRFEE